ncbi:bi-domain-containing oxidoreductase [Zooshikella ganghwensis]|uniref:bi-domain-containing oxidoreductase n=1 Tax=Zooshikella ganghwensis TaxID=202772 RepID=UPI0004215EA2|nr:bi-domain-containing oxidoreductase [Zooshikella ganghwensis]
MKQVFRRVIDKKGKIVVEDVPVPKYGDNSVLIETKYTLVSSGTESATLSKTFPELIKQIANDPWMRNAVKNLILGYSPSIVKNIIYDEATLMRAIGYSGSGIVKKVGSNVFQFKPGDRVAFAAEGHAEIVAPTVNYVVKVPDNVPLKDASYVTLGGIALQGIRKAEVQIGDRVIVYGLGLVGLLTAQLASISGCEVIGVDIAQKQIDLFKKTCPNSFTINASNVDPVSSAIELTQGYGADVVIICASSKKSIIPNNAMKMCRKQGRVVFVGIVKMDLERMPFFLNELDIRFSRAYGPGCFDPDYNAGRTDYPYEYIRWTEHRNLQEFIKKISVGKINLNDFLIGEYPVDSAQDAYNDLYSNKYKGCSVLIKYSRNLNQVEKKTVRIGAVINKSKITLAFLGCGNFARSTLLPYFYENNSFVIKSVISSSGVNAISLCDKYNIQLNSTDIDDALTDPDIDAVVISTRHNSHADLACKSLKAGKHVFLEKPAALTYHEYEELLASINSSNKMLMIGYNRRFAKVSKILKSMLDPNLPLFINYQVHIPVIPSDHWTLNEFEGGGRLIGEAEHFFDYMNYLTDQKASMVKAQYLRKESENIKSQCNFCVTVGYDNKAIGVLTYLSFGHKKLPREFITVHQGGTTYSINNFKSINAVGSSNYRKIKIVPDMGHKEEINYFCKMIKDGGNVNSEDVLSASKISLDAFMSLNKKI